jgi:hypothetical protein
MRATALTLAALAALAVHALHRKADELRFDSTASTELLFLPSPTTFRVATMGYHEPTADLLWMRAVLVFGERYGRDPDPRWGEWLGGMILAIDALDPGWRTPYFYGGTMLRGIGAIDASDAVFLAAMEHLPDDPYFPFALGMNHYLQRGDLERAIHWIDVAAQKPGAPAWYRITSAGILADHDMRPKAIRFLEEQRAATEDPDIREMIDRRLLVLRHDSLAESLDTALARYRVQTSREVRGVQDLAVVGVTVPPDPYGEGWILGADGRFRSAAREREEARRAREAERALLARP